MAIKYSIVVAGLGSIGLRHARLLCERPDVSVAICEPDPQTAERALAVLGNRKRYTSFDEALRDKPDIVWLATPTSLHAVQSIAALESGCHVFCEKPMTATLAEALAVARAVQTSGMAYTVGFPLHFSAGISMLKQCIDNGTLGNILHVYARVGTYITLVNSLSRYQALHPGSLFFDYAHQIDLVYWLLNAKPATVRTKGLQSGDMDFTSAPNLADISLGYDRPLQAHIHLNYVQMPQRHTYEITGDRGWATLDCEACVLETGDRSTQTTSVQKWHQDRDDMFRLEHQAFLDAVAQKRAPETSAADGLVSTAICEAILQSWQLDRSIEVAYC